MHRFPEALGALIFEGKITVRIGAISFASISKRCPNKVLGCLCGFRYLSIIPTYVQFCSSYRTIHLLEPLETLFVSPTPSLLKFQGGRKKK